MNKENAVQQLLNKLRRNRECHNECHKIYSHKNRWFSIPPILFSSISTLVIFEDDDKKTSHYLSAVLNILTVIFSGLSVHLGYKAKSECHLISANSYDELVTKVSFYIQFGIYENREFNNEIQFIRSIKEAIIKIKTANKFQIPKWVLENYDKNPPQCNCPIKKICCNEEESEEEIIRETSL